MLVAARQGVFGSNQVGGGETVRSCSRESERARDVGVRESWYLKISRIRLVAAREDSRGAIKQVGGRGKQTRE